MRERAKRASASETYRPIFSGLKIHLHTYTINAVPFYYLWYGAINDSIGQTHWEKSMTMRASELGNFSHFHILKLLFPSIFCWYFWYFISKAYMFSGLKLHLHNLYTLYNQCSSLLLLMVWRYNYKRQYTGKKNNIEKIYYASELRKIFAFLHSKTAISFNILLVLQILCRYKWHACRITCTNKFPYVPTKLLKCIIGGGGPSGYANVSKVPRRKVWRLGAWKLVIMTCRSTLQVTVLTLGPNVST